MKILLISVPIMDIANGKLYPIAMDRKKVAPPYGVYLLSSVLKDNNHDVTILDLIAEGTSELNSVQDELNTYDLIGIGATTFSWPTARDCIRDIRGHAPDVPIVLGGIHTSMFDEYALYTTNATYVIRGEAEYALVELCEALAGERAFDDVTNLSFRDGDNQIVRNDIKRVVDLSTVPLPDYAELPAGKYAGLSIESSRGCPFDCIFCSTSYRKSYRCIEPVHFVDRLEAILPYVEKTTSGTVHIVDDEFALNRKRVEAIIHEIKRRNLDVRLVFDTRATDLLDEDFVELIAPLVGKFLVGAECGYDEGLEIIGKKTTVSILEQAARNLQKFGISHLADFSFVIGFPWETYDHALKTVDFVSKLFIKYGVSVLLQWYLQVPGSRLWQEQKENGIVHEALYDDYGLFRNTYLFRTGIPFSIEEFKSISEIVTSIRMLHSLSGLRKGNQLEYAHPVAIRRYFPEYEQQAQGTSGLHSLRELSHSAKRRRT
jgi:radical SAM superfamily enzyme YgiQ (UPF0313 family)